MSAIDTYLNGIRNHDWASDVRDDIVNAITECYSNATVQNGSIDAFKIANEAVTTAKIKDSAVTTEKIAAAAITTAKIAGRAINADKIADGAVTSAKIADGAVTTDKITAGAVTTEKIADNAITGDKISKETIDLVANNASTQTIETVNSVAFNMAGSVAVLNCVFTTARVVNNNGRLFSFNVYKAPRSDITVPVFDNSGNVKFVKINTSGDIIVSSTSIPIGTYTLNATWIR